MLVDITPPDAGTVHDGGTKGEDISFSSATASKQCYWDGFSDPESTITNYDIALYINSQLKKTFHRGSGTSFIDHSVALHHEDEVEFQVTATNGAGSTTDVKSDGFYVDQTPPNMMMVSSSDSGLKYQTSISEMKMKWQFEDQESGIKQYRYFVYEQLHGSKTHFWPLGLPYAIAYPTTRGGIEKITISNMSLTVGGQYSVHVTATNNAGMSSAHESDTVLVDNTPPIMEVVSICLCITLKFYFTWPKLELVYKSMS